MEHFNFDNNLKHLLSCDYFLAFRSTRSIKDKNLDVCDKVELQLNHVPVAIATIEGMKSFNIREFYKENPRVMRLLLSMIMGTDWLSSYYSILNNYGQNVTLVLLHIDERL